MNLKHFFLVITMIAAVACEKDDDVAPASSGSACATGILRCTNTSNSTVQRILISGTNYGSLDPGETRSIELAPGSWTLQFIGLNGGSGCSASSFNIAACQTVSRACSH